MVVDRVKSRLWYKIAFSCLWFSSLHGQLVPSSCRNLPKCVPFDDSILPLCLYRPPISLRCKLISPCYPRVAPFHVSKIQTSTVHDLGVQSIQHIYQTFEETIFCPCLSEDTVKWSDIFDGGSCRSFWMILKSWNRPVARQCWLAYGMTRRPLRRQLPHEVP